MLYFMKYDPFFYLDHTGLGLKPRPVLEVTSVNTRYPLLMLNFIGSTKGVGKDCGFFCGGLWSYYS